MSKLASQIATPIILVGLFVAATFIAIDYDRLDAGLYIIILYLVVFMFFFGLAIGNSFSSPIKEILDRALESNNEETDKTGISKEKNELAQLAEIVDKMTEELKISKEQGLETEKALGLKVRAKTRDLEEVIISLEQKVKNRTAELDRFTNESNRLQEYVKAKEAEVAQLKSELENVKHKLK